LREFLFKAIAEFIGVILGFAIILVGLLYQSMILVTLWSWFITPYFQNMPELHVWLAFGLILCVQLLAGQIPAKETNSVLMFLFVRPSFFYCFGWIAHSFLS
jgi:hypothetical protein